MDNFLNRHTVKIQFTTALAVVGFIVYWVFTGSGYVRQVQVHEEEINEIKPKVERIPIMENNIADMKDDLLEIKGDVKTLIKQR